MKNTTKGYDIREWSPDDSRCGKGSVLTETVMKKLYKLQSEVEGA